MSTKKSKKSRAGVRGSKPDRSKADTDLDDVSYNKMGHPERTSHKDGSTERVFNEIELEAFLSNITGNNITSESFTGTGAIAFTPISNLFTNTTGSSITPSNTRKYEHTYAQRKSNKRRSKLSISIEHEDIMRSNKGASLTEAEGFHDGFPGGDHQMDHLPERGTGVAGEKPTPENFDNLGNTETNTTDSGKEWPRKIKDNLAMTSVGDDGTSGSASEHESAHATATDTFTKNIGKEWPRAQKNTGSGVAEPFGNNHEGELESGTAPGGFGAPKVEEGWSVDDVNQLIEDNTLSEQQLQNLFDAYAKNTDYVTLEDFAALLHAYGAEVLIDESSLLNLMARNQSHIFHERRDGTGAYWFIEDADTDEKPWEKAAGDAEPEDEKPWETGAAKDEAEDEEDEDEEDEDNEDEEDEDEDEDEDSKKPWEESQVVDHDRIVREWVSIARKIIGSYHGGYITEETTAHALQVSFNVHINKQNLSECASSTRSTVRKIIDEYGLSFNRNIQTLKEAGSSPVSSSALGMPGLADPGLTDQGAGLDSGLGGVEPGMDPGLSGATDPGLGAGLGAPVSMAPGTEPVPGGAEPGIDAGLGEPTGVEPGMNPGLGSEEFGAGDLPGGGAGIGGEARPRVPGMGSRFGGGYQESAAATRRVKGGVVTEELSGAGHQMDRVGPADGVAEDSPATSSGLPAEDTDTHEVKEKDLLGAAQHNTGDGQTAFTDGGVGKLSGSDGLSENIKILSRAVRRLLHEHAHALRGDFTVKFRTVVDTRRAGARGGKWVRTPVRTLLGEALVDAEELVLFFGPKRVVLEAAYCDRRGGVIHQARLRLPAVRRRAPLLSNGSPVFRFAETAEIYIGGVLEEGYAARVLPHNWGHRVTHNLSRRAVGKVFSSVIA